MLCVDTSALIAAWDERYPIENFPKLWVLIDELIAAGGIVAPTHVLDEIEKKSDELFAWLKDREEQFIVPDEIEPLLLAKAILQEHPRLVMQKKQRFAADPFVIALAKHLRVPVVTEERMTGSMQRPNIPDVCNVVDVECMSLLDMIRAQNWVVG
jgi:hypothetical protein